MPVESPAPTPEIGQTWETTDAGMPRQIVIQDLSTRKVVYHNARKELRSMTHATLWARFRLVVPAIPQRRNPEAAG